MITRKMSLESDFLNGKTDDLLYGFMRSLSTAEPIEDGLWREYLPKKTFVKHKKIIASICGKSTRTIEKHINELAEKGLIDEGIVIVKNSSGQEYEYPCYWFPVEAKAYKLVDKEMLRYLVDTRNANCIKVYLYLLNKYEWKQNYQFTLKELAEMLGYSGESGTVITSMKNITDSLQREGIIRFENTYELDYKGELLISVPVKELKYVAKTVKEIY